MAKEFRLEISTPSKICVDKNVVGVSLPTATGYIGILPKHAKICGAVTPGFLTINFADGKKETALINYGLYYFKEEKLVILSDFFEYDSGLNSNALESIATKIEQETKKVQLSDKAIHALNSYMKLVTAQAKNKKK